MAALLLGVALNPVNSTLIATALGPIANDLAVSAGSTQILVTSLYLVCTIAQPTAGKLAQQLGGRKVLIAGALCVLIGGLVGGFGTSLLALVVARVIIGLGTSAGYPSAMLLVSRRAHDRGLGSEPRGILAAIAAVGLVLMAVGPPVGGVLVATLGWRSTFLVNVPVAIVTVVLALVGIPREKSHRHEDSVAAIAALDPVGIMGFAVTMVLLIIFLFSLPRPIWLLLIAAVALGVAFVWWERHIDNPFFDVRALESNRPLVLNYIRTALAMLGSYVVLYGLPQWLEGAHGLSSDIAGLVIVPMGVVSALVSTWASKRGLVRIPLVGAGVGMVLGGLLLANLGDAGLLTLALVASAAFGITLGASMSSSQLALYGQVAPERMGVASGLLRTFTYFGSIGASVVSGLAFAGGTTDYGLHVIAWIVVALGVVVVAITVCDRSLAS